MWTSTIIILFIVIFISLFIRTRLKFREKAISIAQKECNRYKLQLLDESIELISTKLKGKLVVLRVYNFEYSYDSIQRYTGIIEIRGQNTYKVFFPDIHPNSLDHQSDNVVELSSYKIKKRNLDGD